MSIQKITTLVRPRDISRMMMLLTLLLPFLWKVDMQAVGTDEQLFWFQRAGAIVTIYGVYWGINESTLPNSKKLYTRFSFYFTMLGTIIWAFGDLPFR